MGVSAQLMPKSAFPLVAESQSVAACGQPSRCGLDGQFCSFFHPFLQERFRAGAVEKPASADRAPILKVLEAVNGLEFAPRDKLRSYDLSEQQQQP